MAELWAIFNELGWAVDAADDQSCRCCCCCLSGSAYILCFCPFFCGINFNAIKSLAERLASFPTLSYDLASVLAPKEGKM